MQSLFYTNDGSGSGSVLLQKGKQSGKGLEPLLFWSVLSQNGKQSGKGLEPLFLKVKGLIQK